jgi:AraC-like DNA-binding protein
VRQMALSGALAGLVTSSPEGAGWLAPPVLAAIIVGIVVCLVSVTVALTLHHRHSRQIAALMARLDLVEARQQPPEVVDLAQDWDREHDPRCGSLVERPSDDVLAGRTSYVEAMVEGSRAEAVSLTDRIIVCIHANLKRALSPSELAEELQVSLRTVERILAATLECTPTQLIVAMKMRTARQLLTSGRYRVNEVAYRLGFSNPAHFSSRFKAFYRVPPSELLPQGLSPSRGVADTTRPT